VRRTLYARLRARRRADGEERRPREQDSGVVANEFAARETVPKEVRVCVGGAAAARAPGAAAAGRGEAGRRGYSRAARRETGGSAVRAVRRAERHCSAGSSARRSGSGTRTDAVPYDDPGMAKCNSARPRRARRSFMWKASREVAAPPRVHMSRQRTARCMVGGGRVAERASDTERSTPRCMLWKKWSHPLQVLLLPSTSSFHRRHTYRC